LTAEHGAELGLPDLAARLVLPARWGSIAAGSVRRAISAAGCAEALAGPGAPLTS